MPIKHAILGILKEAPRHGYEMKSLFNEKVGAFWNLNYGQIYTTLDRLTKEGFVDWVEEEQNTKPDRKVYYLSPKGEQELARWLQKPSSKTRPLRDELFIKLLFLDKENPKKVYELIEHQTEVYLKYMRDLTERKYQLTKDGINRENIITDLLMDVALFHAEADVRWLRHAEGKLKEFYRKER